MILNIILTVLLFILSSKTSIKQVVINASNHSIDVETTNSTQIQSNDSLIFTSTSNAIHLFNSNRNTRKVYSKKGRGPGELSVLWRINLIDDYLYAYDISNKKIIQFDLELNYLNEFVLLGDARRSFYIRNTEIILGDFDDTFTLASYDLNKSEKINSFHEKIIPTGFHPAAYNATIFEVFGNHIIAKFRAVDSLYYYDLKTKELVNRYHTKIEYEKNYDNPPVIATNVEYKGPILIPFSDFKIESEKIILGVIEGYVTVLSKEDNSFKEVNKILLVDDNKEKIYVDNISITKNYIDIYARGTDKVVRLNKSIIRKNK